MERVISYIDGFNLYFGLKSKNWQRYYWLNIQMMMEKLLIRDQVLVKTKYFTTRVIQPEDKMQRQDAYLDALSTLSNFDIYYGRFQLDKQMCSQCHKIYHIPHEKKSDVNIATELLSDAYEDQFDTAILVSADADLVSPIEKIKNKFTGKKRIVIAFPPDRSSFELANIASANFRIGRVVIQNSQFSDQVITRDGYTVNRPISWR